MKPSVQKTARFGLLLALALVLGLADRAIPLGSLIGGGTLPGIRLGLANTVLIYAVWMMGPGSSACLMLAKVVLSGLLYGSLSGMLYSLSGGLLSLAVMLALHEALRRRGLSEKAGAAIPVSMAGAAAHNAGQVLAAAAAVNTPVLLGTYLPVLVLIGAGVGLLTGTAADRVIRILGRGRNNTGEERQKP